MSFLLYSFFWVIPGVLILSADVSEHSICYIFISGVSRKNITYKDGTECSETSAPKIQTPGYHPKERIQRSEHGEILRSEIYFCSYGYWVTVEQRMNVIAAHHMRSRVY
jgi:hypothetical protein